jgi:hypothetical protein
MKFTNKVVLTAVSFILCISQNVQSNSFDHDQIFTIYTQRSPWTEDSSQPAFAISGFRFDSDTHALNTSKTVDFSSGDSASPDFWGWKTVTLVSSAYHIPGKTFNSEFTTAATLPESMLITLNISAANRQINIPPDGIWPSAGFSGAPDRSSGSASLQLTTAMVIADGIEDAPIWQRFFQSIYGQFATVSSDSPAPVPEPATMLLFGTGLAGLAGIVARRRKK